LPDDLDEDFPVLDDNIGAKEVVRRLRSEIPAEHRTSNDTRFQWLWMQRLATVQSIRTNSKDIQDRMAATLVLSAAMGAYLPSIELLLQRLEGGAVTDEAIVEQDSMIV